MAPTLADGDTVLATKGEPLPGDVALVSWARRPHQLSVKRVVRAEAGGWHVRGDNRFGSTDSRELGPARVHALIRWRLWPRPGRLRQDRSFS